MPFNFKPTLVRRITYVIHKEKKSRDVINTHAHYRYGHEFIYMDYGKILLTIENKKFTLSSGECIFIHGGKKHSFVSEQGTHFDFLDIMFRGNIPDVLWGKTISVNRNCVELLEQMKEENLQQMPYYNDIVACCMTKLIVFLFRQISAAVPNKTPDAPYRREYKSEAVNKAIAVIAANYTSPLTLKHLSRSVGISIPHLRTLLKKETGDNFSTILHKHRISAAKGLIKDEMPLQDVITAIGYSSSSFFFKIFKRCTAMTPKEYLNSLGEPTER
ncbi:MAG: hypothetical protein A2017_17205 [Lentisphaerae bacterium GWF2_44_16]|nr:MAG: hypothetical protein A2017_17205 [Lentisphaerae bacterium GWF2_44_16]